VTGCQKIANYGLTRSGTRF